MDDVVKVKLWRNGELIEKEVRLGTYNRDDCPIPYFRYDRRPEYLIIGGYVMQELDWDYLNEYGDDWESEVDPLVGEYLQKNYFHFFKDRERIVILNHILRYPINQGYQDINNRVISSINGVRVKNLKHAAELLSKPEDSGYYVIQFEGMTVDVVIPVSDLEKANQDISAVYSIQELSCLIQN